MSWYWFARSQNASRSALAWAEARSEDGSAAGVLAAWPQDERPPGVDTRIDARAIDPGGADAWISLVLVSPVRRLPFDDTAVSHALRRVLRLPAADALSTLVVGDDTFGGSVTVVRDRDRGRLDGDPFAILGAAERLHVDEGLFGTMPAPVGPVIQRYGAGNPWPWDRF